MRRLLMTFTALAGLTAAQAAEAPKPMFGSWGVDLAGMDKSVKPGDDFFKFVNGAWYKTAEIPADRSSIGGFTSLAILSEQRLKELVAILEAKKDADLSAEERQIKDFYDTYVDTAALDKAGLKFADKDLKRFAALKTLADVSRVMGEPNGGIDGPFNSGIDADPRNSDAYILYIGQGGLGLPDRDYYIKDDKALKDTREAYRKFLGHMLELAGYKDAASRGDAVFALETEIAKVSWAAADRRDPQKTNNPMTFNDLDKYAPGFDWHGYFSASGLSEKAPGGDRIVNVAEKTAFPEIAKIFAKTPVAVWRDFLITHYLHRMAGYLPKKFDDANFEFYGTVLRGNKQQLPRETRAVHELDNRLGHLLGKLYVASSSAAKAKADELRRQSAQSHDADIKTLT
ncbi:MAG: M13 family metallopeptidase N-terminal domain-containing protein [Alphaproteobacteria bacterium]